MNLSEWYRPGCEQKTKNKKTPQSMVSWSFWGKEERLIEKKNLTNK